MKNFLKKIIDDNFQYRLSLKAIEDTERILLDYGSSRPANEGIVYWAGTREGNVATVHLVVAPKANSDFGCVTVSNDANFHFVNALCERKYVQIAQIHTHPSGWVDHSSWDNAHAAFKVRGLLSIVVPNFCKQGMLPLKKCGVHRFDEKFFRLSDKYVNKHFKISSDIKSDLEDLRK